MKRYLLTLLSAAFAFCGIGAYYAFGTRESLPEFRLVAVKGDAAEAAAIRLGATYGSGIDIYPEHLEIGAEGSEYDDQASFYRRTILEARWIYQDPDIRQWIRDYRQFMRGKGNMASFYKDGEWLIYAEVAPAGHRAAEPEAVLRVHLLNLASGKASRLEMRTAGRIAGGYAGVEDVQRLGNRLHILTTQRVWPAPGNGPAKETVPEFHDYVVDLDSGKLAEDRNIPYGTEDGSKAGVYLSTITESVFYAPSDCAILRVQQYGSGPSSTKEERERFYAYDYASGQATELPASWTKAGEHRVLVLRNGRLNVLDWTQPALRAASYDLRSGQVRSEISLKASQLGADAFKEARVQNGRIYVRYVKDGTPMFAVADDGSGKWLFEGRVEPVGASADDDEAMKNLQIIAMSVNRLPAGDAE